MVVLESVCSRHKWRRFKTLIIITNKNVKLVKRLTRNKFTLIGRLLCLMEPWEKENALLRPHLCKQPGFYAILIPWLARRPYQLARDTLSTLMRFVFSLFQLGKLYTMGQLLAFRAELQSPYDVEVSRLRNDDWRRYGRVNRSPLYLFWSEECFERLRLVYCTPLLAANDKRLLKFKDNLASAYLCDRITKLCYKMVFKRSVSTKQPWVGIIAQGKVF